MNTSIRMSISTVMENMLMDMHIFMSIRMSTNQAVKKLMTTSIPGTMALTTIPIDGIKDQRGKA
jgi:hypothetical protein